MKKLLFIRLFFIFKKIMISNYIVCFFFVNIYTFVQKNNYLKYYFNKIQKNLIQNIKLK